jgi:hypothetical protein
MELLAGESEPVTVLADCAYGSGELRAELAAAGHIDRVKPAPTRSAVPGGFTVDDFTVDHTNQMATCPAGISRPISRTGVVTFKTACRGCGLRERCTSVAGKKLNVQPHDELQRDARSAARNTDWFNEYRQHRPMVEHSIAWLTRGNRRVRYRGVIKNDHWLHHRAAAINLRRLTPWAWIAPATPGHWHRTPDHALAGIANRLQSLTRRGDLRVDPRV